MATTGFLGNHRHEETSDLVFLIFHHSLVFSTQLTLAAFNHHFIQVFIWITIAFISSTSAAQRKVCRAPRRLVYRGKVSHVLSGASLQMMTGGSAEPQSPNESLMRGSQGEFGGRTAEAAAMLEDVSQKACRQETFKRQLKANLRKHFHSALMRFYSVLKCVKFNLKHLAICLGGTVVPGLAQEGSGINFSFLCVFSSHPLTETSILGCLKTV